MQMIYLHDGDKNPEVAKKKLRERIEDFRILLSLWGVLVPVLETFEGKQITKRIQTKVEEALRSLPEFEGFHAYYSKSYSWYSLKISKYRHKFEHNRDSFEADYMLRYFSEGDTFDMVEFYKKNKARFFDNVERGLRGFQEGLDNIEQHYADYVSAVEAWNSLYERLNRLGVSHYIGKERF